MQAIDLVKDFVEGNQIELNWKQEIQQVNDFVNHATQNVVYLQNHHKYTGCADSLLLVRIEQLINGAKSEGKVERKITA